ncbi:BIR protein, partial [Plasmodium berghei]
MGSSILVDVCGTIEKIDKCLTIDKSSTGNECSGVLYTAFCPTNKEGQKGQCATNGDKISADFKSNIINSDMYVSTDGIYNILERNNPSWYNQFRDKLNKKKKSIDFSDHHIRNLYKLLNELCTLITKYNQDRSNPEAYLEYANKCAETYKNLVTTFSAVKNYDSYCDVLSTLKSEYDKFKEENKDPECQLPEFDGIESCKDLCKQKKQKAEIDNNSGDGLVDGKVYIDGGSDDNQRNYEESRSGQGATNSVPGENDAQNTPGITFDIGRSVFTSVLNRTFNFAETYKEKIINISKGIPGVYNKTLNNIKNGFSKSINFFNEIIGSIRSSSKKVEISGDSGDKRHGLEGTRDKSPTSNDSPSPQETPSKTSSPSSSTEQTKTSESSQ